MRGLVAICALVGTAAAAPRCPTADAVDAWRAARARLAEGDAARAADLLLAARAACPAPALDFYLASAYEKLGRLRPALDALHKYLAAAGDADNRAAVEAWAAALQARADAEQQGLPPPPLPPRTPMPSPAPPYGPEEPIAAKKPAPPPARGEGERWLVFGAAGFAANARLQPGSLSSHAGTVGDVGGGYQIGVAYRLSLAARIDLQALIAGQVYPWTRADLPSTRNALFATLIGVGLRADLPMVRREAARLLASPSAAIGLGSLSLNTDPRYENALALRFGLALVFETGVLGFFIEPDVLLLLAGDLANGPQWTVGAGAGVRVRF